MSPEYRPMAESAFRNSGQSLLSLVVQLDDNDRILIPDYLEPNMHRIRALDFRISGSSAPHLVDFLSLRSPLTMIETLNVCWYHRNYDLRFAFPFSEEQSEIVILKGARNLRKFVLNTEPGYLGPMGIPHRFHLPCAHLVELDLHRVLLQTYDIHTILLHSPHLVCCNFRLDDDVARHGSSRKLDSSNSIHVPRLRDMTVSCASKVLEIQGLFRPLVLPSLTRLTMDCGRIEDGSVLVDLLQPSSSPLTELRLLYGTIIDDIGLILEHCPTLVDINAARCPLPTFAIAKIASDEWVPQLEFLECRVSPEAIMPFLDMLEHKWASLAQSQPHDSGTKNKRLSVINLWLRESELEKLALEAAVRIARLESKFKARTVAIYPGDY